MNVETSSKEVIEAAKKAVEAQDDADKSVAVQEAIKTINSSVKNAASVSAGVFQVMLVSKKIEDAYGAFETAERSVIQHYKKTNPSIKTMKDIADITGVSAFSYTSIRNAMLKAASDADHLCTQLQALYDFQYDNMSKEDQAKEAHQFVEDGFLNPWHARYVKRTPDDEAGHTKFNRDRRLAEGSLKALNEAKRVQVKARKAADQRASEKLAADLAKATATADTAPAGSGGTAQGMASGTGSRHTEILSLVLRTHMGMLTNAVHRASEYLADSEIIPLLGTLTDKLNALCDAEIEVERKRTAELSKSHDNPVAPLGVEEPAEQTELEAGDVVRELPDIEADPASAANLSETDKALIQEFGNQA